MIDAMAFDEFARRVEQEPDLELGWEYWNWLLPTTTGVALQMLFIMPMLRDAAAAGINQTKYTDVGRVLDAPLTK